MQHQKISDDLAVEDALHEDGLRGLGTHVRVRRLLRHEDTADLAQLRIDLVDLHLDGALADVEDLVGLLEELLLATLAIGLQSRQRHGLVVAGVHTTALGVQEAARAVGGHLELATPSEARLELRALALGQKALHGEEEGHVLRVRQLHGRRLVVHAVLLLEGDGVGGQGAIDEGQGVGLASHELGGHELLLAAVRLCLDREGLRLEAHVRHPGSRLHLDGRAVALHGRAAVRQARALDLGIGQLAELLGRDGLGRCGHAQNTHREAEGHGAAEDRRGPGLPTVGGRRLRGRRLLQARRRQAHPSLGTGDAGRGAGDEGIDCADGSEHDEGAHGFRGRHREHCAVKA
mmetsp:Transcript_26459/g.66990  ORF Transcript_26459/g.66990 Transcript_26459/m.66990 type:complete len:347 (-) Transcript_26459:27-1067(-)